MSLSESRPRSWLWIWSHDAPRGLRGAERRMVDVTRELTTRGHSVRSVHFSSVGGELSAAMADAGAQVDAPFSTRNLRKIVCAKDAGTVAVSMGLQATTAAVIVRRGRRGGSLPRLWHSQTGLDQHRGRLGTAWGRRVLARADMILANSQAAADFARDWLGNAKVPVAVVPSALGPEWTHPATRRAGWVGVQPVVAMIGNSRPEKNHEAGVRVFASLPEEALLDVYTDDGTTVRAAADGLGVSDRVRIHENELVSPQTYAGTDVLLHPSTSESMPRTVLEALSQQVQVAAYDIGDIALYLPTAAPVGNETALARELAAAVRATGDGAVTECRVPTVCDYVDELERLAVDQEGRV